MKASIITVTFNSQDTIKSTIESVINQTYNNIEYIIIDGGSTDATIDIIKRYESKIAKWISEKDEGIYDALNKGLRFATGDLVGFLHVNGHLKNSIFGHKKTSNFGHEKPAVIQNLSLAITVEGLPRRQWSVAERLLGNLHSLSPVKLACSYCYLSSWLY